MSSRSPLSEEQRAIAFHNDCEGPILVEAAAGSGKTRILTERARHLLTERKDKFFGVLCLTFTNKAAEEMQERLSDIPRWQERAYIGTFHEFCLNKILRTRYADIGLSALPHIFSEDDKVKTIEEIIFSKESLTRKYEAVDQRGQRELLSKSMDFISRAKRYLITVPEYDSTWEDWGEDNTYLYKEYTRQLVNQNAMDYDDILLYAYRIVSERPATAGLYRRSYRYVMVDEAQDLNYAQYQILRVLFGEGPRNVMMVGDPKQAIYGFNGADPKYMQVDFIKDFGAEKREIKTNYRSARRILEIAEAIQPNGGPKSSYFEGIAECRAFHDEEAEAQWVIDHIKAWEAAGRYEEAGKDMAENIALNNIAVLARNKFVFHALIKALERDEALKNRFYLRKGAERFEPESILLKVFDLGLRILINPHDILHFRQLLNELRLPPQDEDDGRKERLFALQQAGSEVLDGKALALLVELWRKLDHNPRWLGKALQRLEAEIDGRSLNIADEEAPKVAYDLAELQKFWSAFERKEAAENQSLSNFRYFLALNGSKEQKTGLMLATVHTAKGLEFDIVFLIGMCEGVFPDYRAKGKPQHREERNNAYVAVTRAKRAIYISYPQSRLMPWGEAKAQQISTFIEGLPLS